MAYELRVGGSAGRRFETEPEAIDAAKQTLRDNPDAEPEVIDLATGMPASPGASRNWREELKTKVGF